MSDSVASRLRAVSSSGGSQPNSKIKDLCSDAAAEIDRLECAGAQVAQAMVEAAMLFVPLSQRDRARDTITAVGLGIIHGTMGPRV